MEVTRKPATCFEELTVWQKAHDLVLSIYRLSAGFPRASFRALRHGFDAPLFLFRPTSPKASSGVAPRRGFAFLHRPGIAVGSEILPLVDARPQLW